MMGTGKSKQTDIKTHILDVAERLFAQNGFRRTSIKLLARMANVNQAAVNYHFGSKSALVERVIERRLAPIHAQRIQNFIQIKAAATCQKCRPDIAEILRAFVEPAFTLTETLPKDRSFLAIASRAFSEPDDAIRSIFLRNFKPSFELLAELTQQALPDLPETVVLWRLNFVIGAMSHCMHLCGDRLPVADFFPPVEETDVVVERLVAFLSKGMEAADELGERRGERQGPR
jgi:AcrR family transcriptional regulator